MIVQNVSFTFTECPPWDGQEFILQISQRTKSSFFFVIRKTFTAVIANAERSNSFMFDKNKNQIVCEGDSGKIQKRMINRDLITTIASTYNGTYFNMK